MSHILTVGIATLDIINLVDHYPAEDEEMRALGQRVECGGNAANTASVLAQYGHVVEFAGALAHEPDGYRIEHELKARHVATGFCQHVKKGKAPTSYITLNQQTGSRTIVHYRDLPEYNYQRFHQIPLEEFDWFHFEGRNASEVRRMLKETQQRRVDQPISLEIEKEREEIDSLLPLADILLFSRVFVTARGFDNPAAFFDAMRPHAPEAVLVCTWGDQGAWARDRNSRDYHAPAYPPPEIIDTLGAGETFNAGLIHAIASGQTLAEALVHACQLAGKKVGQHGFGGLTQ
jgi:ketohexokinase